jgi:hypothetical protein
MNEMTKTTETANSAYPQPRNGERDAPRSRNHCHPAAIARSHPLESRSVAGE